LLTKEDKHHEGRLEPEVNGEAERQKRGWDGQLDHSLQRVHRDLGSVHGTRRREEFGDHTKGQRWLTKAAPRVRGK